MRLHHGLLALAFVVPFAVAPAGARAQTTPTEGGSYVAGSTDVTGPCTRNPPAPDDPAEGDEWQLDVKQSTFERRLAKATAPPASCGGARTRTTSAIRSA